MDIKDQSVPPNNQLTNKAVNTITWFIRSVIVSNFVLFAFSFSPQFEGSAEKVGMADRIFTMRWGGYRIDFAWLVISTLVIFLAMFYFFLGWKRSSKMKINAFFCLAWVIAFLIYLARALLTGVLYFG